MGSLSIAHILYAVTFIVMVAGIIQPKLLGFKANTIGYRAISLISGIILMVLLLQLM